MCLDSSVMKAWQKVSISMRDLPCKHGEHDDELVWADPIALDM